MTRVLMYLYSNRSQGGLALKEALGIQSVLHSGTQTLSPSVVVNWGSGCLPQRVKDCQVINQEAAVLTSINKLSTFRALDGKCRHVPYTTEPSKAIEWMMEGHKVVCRDTLEGRTGQGIRIIDARGVDLPLQGDLGFLSRVAAWFTNGRPASNTGFLGPSRLFTRFVPSTREYRVHVVGDRAINVRRKNAEDFYNVTIHPEDVVNQAVAATAAVGLDFAGVDVLWDGVHAWVLETNTAPGIGGITVGRYAEALRELIKERWNVSI